MENGEEYLLFQINRAVKTLFKNHLILLEELAEKHDEALAKLYEKLPNEYKPYVDLADYLTESESERLRKRVLDGGNETLRNLEDVAKKLDVKFK